MNEIFEKAVPILKKITAHNYQAYFVGGAVRDFLMGRDVNDIDIATSATPIEVKNIFPKTIDVGLEHGTVVVLFQGESFEITTFRTEGKYEDFRRPNEVQFVRSLASDLERRDFTINALAMDAEGEIYDFFNGKKDIEEKVIRAVGNPHERFQEDALRMLRAVRFESQLGFELASDTKSAIEENVSLLQHISQERKTIEFEKLLMGQYPEKGLRSLVETRIVAYLPGFEKSGDILKSLFTGRDIRQLKTLEEIWSYLLIEQAELPLKKERLRGNTTIDYKNFLTDWKLSNEKIKKICTIIKFYNAYGEQGWTNQLLFAAGLDTVRSVENILSTYDESYEKHGVHLYQELKIKHQSQLAINGNDLLNWTKKQAGPWVKEVLAEIIDNILEGNMENEREQIYQWFLQKKLI